MEDINTRIILNEYFDYFDFHLDTFSYAPTFSSRLVTVKRDLLEENDKHLTPDNPSFSGNSSSSVEPKDMLENSFEENKLILGKI